MAHEEPQYPLITVSIETLAKDRGLTPATVRRHLKELERAGYLEILGNDTYRLRDGPGGDGDE